MDTPDSLVANVGALLPSLSSSQVTGFVNQWINVYGSWFGKTFNQTTQLPEPFTWVITTGLNQCLASYGLTSQVPAGSDTYNALLRAWSRLTPWPFTGGTLQFIQESGFKIGVLSNGDYNTLYTAQSVFQRTNNVTMDVGPFGSDYPVGAFKPHGLIYKQLTNQYPIESILHVAGSPVDAAGARTYGLYAALLHNTNNNSTGACFNLQDISLLPAVLGLA